MRIVMAPTLEVLLKVLRQSGEDVDVQRALANLGRADTATDTALPDD